MLTEISTALIIEILIITLGAITIFVVGIVGYVTHNRIGQLKNLTQSLVKQFNNSETSLGDLVDEIKQAVYEAQNSIDRNLGIFQSSIQTSLGDLKSLLEDLRRATVDMRDLQSRMLQQNATIETQLNNFQERTEKSSQKFLEDFQTAAFEFKQLQTTNQQLLDRMAKLQANSSNLEKIVAKNCQAIAEKGSCEE